MNSTVRLFLCLTCVVVGVLEAPRAMSVLGEDLRGPYAPLVDGLGHKPPVVLAWTEVLEGEMAEGNGDAVDRDTALVARGNRR